MLYSSKLATDESISTRLPGHGVDFLSLEGGMGVILGLCESIFGL